jgi:circadian clock protein KaiC
MVDDQEVDEPELPKITTGNRGLDDILGGGVDPERMYLFEGQPGSGKTTLALEFLLEGARRGDPALYITLSETERELRLVAKRHGWSLEGIAIFELIPAEASLDPGRELTVLHPAEMELSETTQTIFDRVEALAPSRIVLDSLSELRLLAQSPLRYRRQILALKHFFSGRRSTVVLLDDLSSQQDDLQLHSIVHGVVLLEQLAIDYGAQRRRLRVVKMRGIDFKGGFHDFTIRPGGLMVYPRLVAAEHHSDFDTEVVSRGNSELDSMLGGGIERGTNMLLIGAAGVGKSSLALTYAIAAASRHERSAVFAFDEGRGTMKARAKTLGLPLQEGLDSGLIEVQQIDPAEMAPGELLAYLSQRGVSTILVLAQHGLVGPMDTPLDISYLADAVLMLRYFEFDGGVRRALSVVKKRSGNHEHTIREFKLSGQGITVGPPLKGFSGIFTGTPIYNGEEAPLLSQADAGR